MSSQNQQSQDTSENELQLNKQIVRPLYLQETLNKDADYHFSPKSPVHIFTKALMRCDFSDCLRNSIHIINWLPKYKWKKYLLDDFIAGTTTATINISIGMAGSLLAQAPPVMGLYMAFFPLLIYVIFGKAPHIALGTFAVACLMAGEVVNVYAMDTDDKKALYTPYEVLSSLTFVVGILQVLLWCLRLGVLSALLSAPLVTGFTSAASMHAVVSQLGHLLGIKLPHFPVNYKIIHTMSALIKQISETNWVTLMISIISCVLLLLNNEILRPWMSKRYRLSVPGELLVMITGTLCSKYLMLHEKYNVVLVEPIPAGLPAPALPRFDLFEAVLLDAVIQTIVTFSITQSMARVFAYKKKYEIDSDQELLAIGASNIFGSFFYCAPICASLSRSYVQYKAGCKTLMTTFIAALWMLPVFFFFGPLFEQQPHCVLASVLVCSLTRLIMQTRELKRFWILSKLDAWVWIVTFITTLILDLDYGLGAGLIANIAAIFYRSQMPYTCLLGRMADTDIYLDIKRYRGAQEIPGIKIFHYCGGLNFATKNIFRALLFHKTGYMRMRAAKQVHTTGLSTPSTVTSSPYEWDPNIRKRLQCVVIDARALSYVDAPGIKILVAAQQELTSCDITVLLACANAPVLEMIEKFNALEPTTLRIPIFPTVHDAVMYYLSQYSSSDTNTES